MHLYISCGLHYVYDFLLMQQQSSKSIHKRPKHLLKCTLADILFIISCHVASVTQTMNIQICMAYLNHKLIFIYYGLNYTSTHSILILNFDLHIYPLMAPGQLGSTFEKGWTTSYIFMVSFNLYSMHNAMMKRLIKLFIQWRNIWQKCTLAYIFLTFFLIYVELVVQTYVNALETSKLLWFDESICL